MRESKGREATAEKHDKVRDREADATSDETLTDLEANKKMRDNEKTSQRDVPAPDAEPEQPRKPRDDAGPM